MGSFRNYSFSFPRYTHIYTCFSLFSYLENFNLMYIVYLELAGEFESVPSKMWKLYFSLTQKYVISVMRANFSFSENQLEQLPLKSRTMAQVYQCHHRCTPPPPPHIKFLSYLRIQRSAFRLQMLP